MNEIEQKPYTIEQYQRCLKAATRLSNSVLEMKRYPLDSDILDEINKAQTEYINTTTKVVNESCGLE